MTYPWYKQNPLVYPAGVTFGKNLSDFATQSGARSFSAVATSGGNFVGVNGIPGTITGAGTTTIDGVMGPAWKNTTSVSTPKVTLASTGPSATDANSTFAVIARPTVLSGQQFLCAYGSGSSGPGLQIAPGLGWNNWGGSNPTAVITLTVNHPYFLLGSSNGAGTCNLLALDLSSGQILTATSAGSALGTSNGTLVIGNSNAGTVNSIAGIIAAVAYVNCFLSMPAMLAWAQDPWSFWYPQPDESWVGSIPLSFIAAAAGIGIATAIGTSKIDGAMLPDADSSTGAWINQSGGAALYSSIDEYLTPNDADYIVSGNNPSNDTCRVSLRDPTATVSQPFNVSYRYGKSGSVQIDITVALKQNVTTIASWTHTDVPLTPITITQTLTSPQFAAITDFTDLWLEFTANAP